MFLSIWLAITTLFGLLVPPATPEALWTAWLYDNRTGEIMEFGPPGNLALRWSLPLQGKLQAPRDVFVSPSGSHLIFASAEGQNSPNILMIYDVPAGEIRYDRGLSLTNAVGTESPELFSVVFDEASGRVALGYYVPFYGAEPATTANWEIAIMDYQTGTIETVLSAPPEIQQIVENQHVYSLPMIERFTGDSVEFAVIAGGTENLPGAPTFAWDISRDSVTQIDHYTSLVTDTWLPTGETIFPMQDEHFGPLQECAGPGAPHMPFSVIARYDPSTMMQMPVYHRADYAPRSAVFVQNGERLLVGECGLVEEQRLLTLIERDGTRVNEFIMPPLITSIRPTPDGFVYLAAADATLYGSNSQVLIPVLMHISTAGNRFQQSLLWQGSQDIYSLSLVHVGRHVPPPDVYRPWQDVIPPAIN